MSFTTVRSTLFRRLSMAGFDAIPATHTMTALVEIDVTRLRSTLRAARREGRTWDFHAAIVAAVARSLARFPQFNAMRWGQKIVLFDGVDVNLPVETYHGDEAVVGSLVIRRAERRTITDLSREIADYKTQSFETLAQEIPGAGFVAVLLGLPRFLRLFVLRRFSSSPQRVREMFGTTMVTSVAQGSDLPGWATPHTFGPRAVSFALGSVVTKPRFVDGQVVPRSILHLSVMLNHDLVDGIPAARFLRDLARQLESQMPDEPPRTAP